MIKNPSPMHPGKVLSEVYMSQLDLNQNGLSESVWLFPQENQ